MWGNCIAFHCDEKILGGIMQYGVPSKDIALKYNIQPNLMQCNVLHIVSGRIQMFPAPSQWQGKVEYNCTFHDFSWGLVQLGARSSGRRGLGLVLIMYVVLFCLVIACNSGIRALLKPKYWKNLPHRSSYDQDRGRWVTVLSAFTTKMYHNNLQRCGNCCQCYHYQCYQLHRVPKKVFPLWRAPCTQNI